VDANRTGGQGLRRAVAPSGDDDDDNSPKRQNCLPFLNLYQVFCDLISQAGRRF
jgi:hypothetical protein